LRRNKKLNERKRQREENRRRTTAIRLLYTSEILSIFIHSEFTRRINPLDDSRILLKAAEFKD
jgi:hypothetical protein